MNGLQIAGDDGQLEDDKLDDDNAERLQLQFEVKLLAKDREIERVGYGYEMPLCFVQCVGDLIPDIAAIHGVTGTCWYSMTLLNF